MKRFMPVVLAMVLAAGVAVAATETVTVIVKKTAIRGDRQFYAPSIAEAEFGDAFSVLERQKGWIKVGAKSGAGWLHESAVTARKVVASAKGPAGGNVADEDVALAGKGFNPQVESEYKKKNPEANYAAVDRLEKIAVDENALEAFGRDGNLQPRGAGQ